MKIKNVKVYGLEESIIRSGYPMQTGEPTTLPDEKTKWISKIEWDLAKGTENKDYNRAIKLANTPSGSGHDNFLKGIIVQFDLGYTQYWTKHLQRYVWFTYFSGQSLMHKLTSVKDISSHVNKWVMLSTINRINLLIEVYNDNNTIYPVFLDSIVRVDSKQDLFHAIISNCPMGYELWQPITTNYMSLKTMYFQRKSHKLYDWKEFCAWIETLPMSELITGKDGTEI